MTTQIRTADMTTESYAEYINQNFDAVRYASLVSSLGNQLNDRKDRFDKSDIIEQSFEVYSDNKFQWVDDIGRDHRDNVNGFDLEFKYMQNGLFTAKGNPKKVITVKVKNSLGVHKGTHIDNPADFYVLAQQDAMAIMSFAELEPYLVAVPDGIEAKIPFDALTFVFEPTDVANDIALNEQINYKQIKAEAQRKLINSF